MQLLAKLSATTLFLQEWLNCPKEVGAILPSSKNLAVAMARPLPPEPDGYALELGPGTGAVTEALLERGLREDRLIAIERSPKMAELLRKRFPRANVINGDVTKLGYQWQKEGVSIPNATNASYSFLVTGADDGKKFRVQLSYPGTTNVTSAEATLTVLPEFVVHYTFDAAPQSRAFYFAR